MIRLLYFVPIWVLFIAIKIPVIVLGLPVVAYLWKFRDVHMDVLLMERPWVKPWLNPEDWTGGPKAYKRTSLPLWWIHRKGGVIEDDEFKIRFGMWWHYHAIRNPANGLRNFEWLDLDIIPEKVRYRTPQFLRHYEPSHVRRTLSYAQLKTYWYLAWQGPRAGFKFVHHWNDKRHLVIKLGWRVEPRDATDPVDPAGIRVEDAGFATKFLPYRKG